MDLLYEFNRKPSSSRQAAGGIPAGQLRGLAQAGRSRAERRALREEDVHGDLRGHHAQADLSARRRRANCRTSIPFPGSRRLSAGSTASGYLKEPWDVSQEIAISSPTEFNHAARNYISRGLNALNMVLDQATRNGHDPIGRGRRKSALAGCRSRRLDDLDRALGWHRSGEDLAAGPLRGFGHALCGAARSPWPASARRPRPALRGCIEMDPLGVLSHEGKLPQSLEGAYREMAALTRWAAERAPHLQTICVHSRAWHEAGGSAVQELAFTLATGVEYLREMNQRGLDVDLVAPRLRFAITVGENFFMEIAKLRALADALVARRLRQRRQRTSAKLDPACAHLALEQDRLRSLQQLAPRRPWKRSPACLGGCDSMQVGAFDEVMRQPDDFSQRLARNTQLILQHECQLEHVIDPAGGSWYVESITAELAAKAWALFQEVEKLGGMAAALQAGFPQKAVASTAAEKFKAVTRRRDSIIGVNQYANPKEKPLEVPGDGCQGLSQAAGAAGLSSSHFDGRRRERNRAGEAGQGGGKPRHRPVRSLRGSGGGGSDDRRNHARLAHQRQPAQPITPVCITRAAVAHGTSARGHRSPCRQRPRAAPRFSCATWVR